MSVETLVSVEQYLNSSYDPDVEYIDGMLQERSVGDWLHSLIQSNIIFALRLKYPRLKVVPELRSQTAATRFRLPDVSVLLQAPNDRYLKFAALVAVEILSQDDRMSTVMEKLREYEAHGVSNIWLIDPRLQELSSFHNGCLQAVGGEELTTHDGQIQLTRAEIFQP